MKFIHLALIFGFSTVMAQPDMQERQSDPDKVYVLKSVSTTSGTFPAMVTFYCYWENKLVGSTLLVVLSDMATDLLNFWEPLLERINRSETVFLEVRGGRFFYTEIPDGDDRKEGWVSYAPAIQPRLSNIRVVPSIDLQ